MKYTVSDYYLYEGSEVLRNKFDIRDDAILQEIEYRFTSNREKEYLANLTTKPTFDFSHLKAVHKHIFQDIYEWAGEERDVDMAKGTAKFAIAKFIASSANTLFKN